MREAARPALPPDPLRDEGLLEGGEELLIGLGLFDRAQIVLRRGANDELLRVARPDRHRQPDEIASSLERPPGAVAAIQDDECLFVVEEIRGQARVARSLEVEKTLRRDDAQRFVDDLELESDVLERESWRTTPKVARGGLFQRKPNTIKKKANAKKNWCIRAASFDYIHEEKSVDVPTQPPAVQPQNGAPPSLPTAASTNALTVSTTAPAAAAAASNNLPTDPVNHAQVAHDYHTTSRRGRAMPSSGDRWD